MSDSPEFAGGADDVVVVAVTDEVGSEALDEAELAEIAAVNREDVDQQLADLRSELAALANTGIPGVDDALAQLSTLDPDDLQGASAILAGVLATLETVMNEAPPE